MSDDSAYAAAPFDHAKADIILRSSDNIDFRIFKLFLSLASPFFKDLFDIPQPDHASKDQKIKDGLAVIPMTEDSKTLDILFRFCYPSTLADYPSIGGFQDALNVLNAAKKYSFDAIEKRASQAIINSKTLVAEPLRCFAILHQERMHNETVLAAKYSLAKPLIPSSFQEINLITASDLLALLSYHQRCGDAVYALRRSMESWIPSHCKIHCYWLSDPYSKNELTETCRCTRSSKSRYRTSFGNMIHGVPPEWWEGFTDEVFTLLRDQPCKETIQASAEKTVREVKSLKCPACSPRVVECMHAFSGLLVKKVEETVSQIELELDF